MNVDKNRLEKTLDEIGLEYSYSDESGYLDETTGERMSYADLLGPWFTVHPLTDENGNRLDGQSGRDAYVLINMDSIDGCLMLHPPTDENNSTIGE